MHTCKRKKQVLFLTYVLMRRLQKRETELDRNPYSITAKLSEIAVGQSQMRKKFNTRFRIPCISYRPAILLTSVETCGQWVAYCRKSEIPYERFYQYQILKLPVQWWTHHTSLWIVPNTSEDLILINTNIVLELYTISVESATASDSYGGKKDLRLQNKLSNNDCAA